MASLGQLNSFVGKFISLWKAGYDANFHVTSHGGEARVNLEVGLAGPDILKQDQRSSGSTLYQFIS